MYPQTLLMNKLFHCRSIFMRRINVRGEATIGHGLPRNIEQVSRGVVWVHNPLHSQSKNTVHAHFGINVNNYYYMRFLFLSVEPLSGILLPFASEIGSISVSVESGSHVCTLALHRRRYVGVS
jgi:hypothetical protein